LSNLVVKACFFIDACPLFPVRGHYQRMTSHRILIAEDDPAIGELLAHHIAREGFQVLRASDGAAALRMAREGVDFIVLDVGMPALDGFEITRTLRWEGRMTPILMLTARVEEIDRIVGFELGADDYVVKPFSPREVTARVRAILRRAGIVLEAGPRVLRFGKLEVDEGAREVRVSGENVGLKPREYALFLLLANNPGIAVSRDQLLEKVWGYDYSGDERTVDVHVRRVRQKIEERHPDAASCIQTIHGYGYKFTAPL
jgi:DNA-binding response OmpR family regulator